MSFWAKFMSPLLPPLKWGERRNRGDFMHSRFPNHFTLMSDDLEGSCIDDTGVYFTKNDNFLFHQHVDHRFLTRGPLVLWVHGCHQCKPCLGFPNTSFKHIKGQHRSFENNWGLLSKKKRLRTTLVYGLKISA